MRGVKSPYYDIRKACGRDCRTPVIVDPGDKAPKLARRYMKRRRWFPNLKQHYEDMRFQVAVVVGIEWLKANDPKAFAGHFAERMGVQK